MSFPHLTHWGSVILRFHYLCRMKIEQIREELENNLHKIEPIGKKLKLILDEHTILIDGNNEINRMIPHSEEADCTISMSVDTFRKIKSKEIKPMIAVMSGKIRIKGDIQLTQKLKNLVHGLSSQ
jgi:putative sterol carrier protein